MCKWDQYLTDNPVLLKLRLQRLVDHVSIFAQITAVQHDLERLGHLFNHDRGHRFAPLRRAMLSFLAGVRRVYCVGAKKRTDRDALAAQHSEPAVNVNFDSANHRKIACRTRRRRHMFVCLLLDPPADVFPCLCGTKLHAFHHFFRCDALQRAASGLYLLQTCAEAREPGFGCNFLHVTTFESMHDMLQRPLGKLVVFVQLQSRLALQLGGLVVVGPICMLHQLHRFLGQLLSPFLTYADLRGRDTARIGFLL